VLNGQVRWQGEEIGDVGVLEVVDNVVTAHDGVVNLADGGRVDKMATELLEIVDAWRVTANQRAEFVSKLREFVDA
jgi:citrate lyase alpha subunit